MPTIPTYSPQVSPAESSRPFLKNVESQGREWRETQGLAGDLMKRAKVMREQKTAMETVDAFSAFSDEWGKFVREELQKKGEDTFDNVERAHEHFEKLKGDYGSRYRAEVFEGMYGQMHNVRQGSLNSLASLQARERYALTESKYKAAVSTVEQMIITNQDHETVARALYGDKKTKVPGLFYLIDQLKPGLDNTQLKANLEQAVWTKFLEQAAIVRPDDVPVLANILEDRLSGDIIQKALSKGEMAEALKDMWANPEKFDSSLYKNLDPLQKERLTIQAEKLFDTRLKKNIAEQNKAERDADKAHKDMIETNDYDVLLKWTQYDPQTGARGITWPQIEGLMEQRKISIPMYKYLIADKDGTDNPVITGLLASSVEMGKDVSESLKRHLVNGDISRKTYITMKKNLGDIQYRQALGRLRGAMEPTAMDKWESDRHLKWEEGFSYFHDLISSGKDPWVAADIVLEGYYGDTRRSYTTLPVPKYLDGSRDDIHSIISAEESTMQAFENGEIDSTIYEHEMRLLEKYRGIIREQMQMQIEARNQDRDKNKDDRHRVKKKTRPQY
jgi:hypothetical protein